MVALNYRLYPKVGSPKYIEDAAAAVAWVFNNISYYGGDTSIIFVSGLQLEDTLPVWWDWIKGG